MFEVPQERVRGGQLVEIAAADVTLVMQFLQREEGPTGTEPGLGTSIHSLQALDEELDIADAAAIHFDVNGFVAFSRNLLAPLAIDFFARQESGFDSREVDLLAVNLWLYSANKRAREGNIARRVANFYKGLPLPIVGRFGVVAQGVGYADRQLAFISLRTQAKINAKDCALSRWTRKDFGELLG